MFNSKKEIEESFKFKIPELPKPSPPPMRDDDYVKDFKRYDVLTIYSIDGEELEEFTNKSINLLNHVDGIYTFMIGKRSISFSDNCIFILKRHTKIE